MRRIPFAFMSLPADEREAFTAKRREKFKEWKRDDLVAAFQEHNHAIEAIINPRRAVRASPTDRERLVKTVVDPVVGATTQVGPPIHMFGTPTAIQGPQPTPRSTQRRDPEGVGTMTLALEGVRLIDFGQYLAGPFGPMIIGDPRRGSDQGRAGHRRRHAQWRPSPSSAASAASATSPSTQRSPRPRDRARARGHRRCRAPPT